MGELAPGALDAGRDIRLERPAHARAPSALAFLRELQAHQRGHHPVTAEGPEPVSRPCIQVACGFESRSAKKRHKPLVDIPFNRSPSIYSHIHAYIFRPMPAIAKIKRVGAGSSAAQGDISYPRRSLCRLQLVPDQVGHQRLMSVVNKSATTDPD